MADYSVVKAASYVLAHTPDMVIHNGTIILRNVPDI